MKKEEFQKKETPIDITTVYIGTRIHSLREERSISQVELGKLIGLSRVSIANIEAGRQNPTIRILMEICLALSTTPDKIFPTREWYLENKNKKARKVVTIEIYE